MIRARENGAKRVCIALCTHGCKSCSINNCILQCPYSMSIWATIIFIFINRVFFSRIFAHRAFMHIQCDRKWCFYRRIHQYVLAHAYDFPITNYQSQIANRKLCLMTVFSSSVSVVSLNELYECAIFKVAKQGTLCKLMFNILHTYTLKYVVQYTLDRTAHTYRQKKERKRCSYAGIIFNTKIPKQ